MTLETIKSTLFTNWHVVRILRLVFGIFVLVQAVTMRDAVAGMISAIFFISGIDKYRLLRSKWVHCATHVNQ